MDASKSILVADDDAAIRSLIKRSFENELHIDEAHNGVVAVELVQLNDYDFVLMDIEMPEMNGVQALLEIKKLKKDLRVLMMTGGTREELITEAFKLGASGLLRKPFTLTQLIDFVRDNQTDLKNSGPKS